MCPESIQLDVAYHVSAEDDTQRFHQAAAWIARRFEIQQLNASIAIVDEQTIHQLNREHLEHDWTTDVISFVFEHSDGYVDGEIIASHDMAVQLGEKANWSCDDELLLYVVHGLLHLVGLDDLTEDGRQEMRRFEKECLLSLGVNASEHIKRWEDISY